MRFTVHQYRHADGPVGIESDNLSEEDARATAYAMLREKCHDAGLVMDGGVTKGEPVPVIVKPDYSGWDPCPPHTEHTGHVIEWSCESTEPIRDPLPSPGVLNPDGTYTVEVPDALVHGGPVRVLHGLDGPVTITAAMREGYTGGGILVSTPISDDEEHVEVLPGVARLTVVRDPEDDDAPDT